MGCIKRNNSYHDYISDVAFDIYQLFSSLSVQGENGHYNSQTTITE